MTAAASKVRLRRALPWLWFGMSLVWAVAIVVTDQLAWPLALWIATTVGPLTYLRNSNHQSVSQEPDRKGSHE